MSSSSRTYTFAPSDRPAKKQRLAVMHSTLAGSGGAPHPSSIVYPTIQSFVAVGQNKRGRDDNSDNEDQENNYGIDRGGRRQLTRYGEQEQQPRRIRRKISPPTPTAVTTNEQPFYPIQGYSYMNGGCN